MDISRIKMLREEKNINQKEFANILKLDNTLYNKYENSYNIIPLKYLNTICNYFNVSFDYILGFSSIKQYSKNNDEINKFTAGTRLKEFRKENKLTQVKLATFLNTSHSTIVEYEKGKNLISTQFLYAICDKYKISADYLLSKTDTPKYLK